MALDLTHCQFVGPALPGPFVRFELENELRKAKLLPKTTGADGQKLADSWEIYRRKLREVVLRAGAIRVENHVIEPLVARLGYAKLESGGEVETREGKEDGGTLLVSADGSARLRTWSVDLDTDLDAPARRGWAFRYSHIRIAQRVLLATGERVGLVTNGVELRILISDPARPDSQVIIPIDPNWKRSRDVSDSYLLLLSLCTPEGVKAIPDLVEKARLQQSRVTKDLRKQAREAVEGFVQEVLGHPANRDVLAAIADRQQLAKDLWHEGLVLVYRLLFILKLESSDDPARAFSFASSSLWRNSFSPSLRLATFAQAALQGHETGQLLEQGLRTLFRMFTDGLQCSELHVAPLGGALFGESSTPLLSKLRWGERAVAIVLDKLLWTPKRRGADARERVHYGSLDVEDLGRVYEALLELEPGITSEPMCRLRRQKLEVVVPVAQGERYRPATLVVADAEQTDAEDDDDSDADDEDESPSRAKKTKVEWIELIPPDRFYLRVGLGRKASGSYYTPHSFVRFLVQETLGPQIAERSPGDNPNPGEILKLKVLDPAMGSGHFLVEACRFLGAALYEACRLCDEKASALERKAEAAKNKAEREPLLSEAAALRQRITDLPDPDDILLRYLPSAAPEGIETGISQRKAEAMCRRLVAVHCLYGVDKNPLAVELAKLTVWLESHSEGLPLTFLDHRLVVGDSLTGPFWTHLIKCPGSQEPVPEMFRKNLDIKFRNRLADAISLVRELEASVGVTQAEIQHKQLAKAKLDRAMLPLRVVAAAWSGGIMLGPKACDDVAYGELLRAVGETGELPVSIQSPPLRRMIARGFDQAAVPHNRDALYQLVGATQNAIALSYDLAFPEVFYPTGVPFDRRGFDAVLGNPPWDAIQFKSKEFFAAFDFEILNAPTKRERARIEEHLTGDPTCGPLFERYVEAFEEEKRAIDCLYEYQKVFIDGDLCGRQLDAFRVFMERNAQLLTGSARVGVVVPSAFHANEGATGVRRLYIEKMALRCCYSFENRRKLFEIHSSFKFAAVVAQKGASTSTFSCAFYLHDDEWLFGERTARPPLAYDIGFARLTGGQHLGIIEIRAMAAYEVARQCFCSGRSLLSEAKEYGIRLQKSPAALDISKYSTRFKSVSECLPGDSDVRRPPAMARAIGRGLLVVHEGKTFRDFEDCWGEPSRYVLAVGDAKDLPEHLRRATGYQFAVRKISSSTNERTVIGCLLPPGVVVTDSVLVDAAAFQSRHAHRLQVAAILNSFAFDWIARQYIAANVNLFILEILPAPSKSGSISYVAHSVLRLSCNHAGYESLWREQLGDTWREPGKKPFTWPVLASDDERWDVRSAIDAVVADAYGLSRQQYEHVLSTFSHKSYPKAPALCLAKFDELKKLGLDKFTRKYDPYHDIPLVETLPQPVIDLPIPTDVGSSAGQATLFSTEPDASPRRRKQRRKQ